MREGRGFTAICNRQSANPRVPRTFRCFSFTTGRGFSACVSLLPALLCLLLVSCAAPSPPQPPSLELPLPVTDLKAIRKGNSVILTWTQPQQTTDGEGIRFLGPTRICRNVLVNPQDKLTECDKPSAELASSQLESEKSATAKPPVRAKSRYSDILSADWMRDPAASITYAIESLNTSHRSAGLSNQVRVPAAITEPPPTDFAASLTDDGVVLTWSGPFLSIPGGDGTPHYYYRVYRTNVDRTNTDPTNSSQRSKDAQPRAFVGEVLQGTQDKMRLVDHNFAWEKTYEYSVNVTTRIASGPPHACPGETNQFPACRDTVDIEGEDSTPATVVAHDVFPPAVPTGLQAVFSGAGQKAFIDLTWNADTTNDLVGYNVYRRQGTSATTKINEDLVKAPAFRDANVDPGQTYFYSVTAVDVRGNESIRSEETSEQVP